MPGASLLRCLQEDLQLLQEHVQLEQPRLVQLVQPQPEQLLRKDLELWQRL